MNKIQESLRTLSPTVLKGIRRGIEKESLRVRPEGKLAMTSHPLALGSALTHPHITTDFSESQLELITGTHGGGCGVSASPPSGFTRRLSFSMPRRMPFRRAGSRNADAADMTAILR